jgi:hypothetical protein
VFVRSNCFEALSRKELPEKFKLTHEINSTRFIDIATDQMSKLHPRVFFNAQDLVTLEIILGNEANRALIEAGDDPMNDINRSPKLREIVDKNIACGDKADVESATQTRVKCKMIGNNRYELDEAFLEIKLLAAEKGGSLIKKEARAENKFCVESHFLFR